MKTPEEIKQALNQCSLERCAYCPYKRDGCVDALLDDALEYINELEARVPRWISVNERLPEEGVWVLTRDIYENILSRSLFVYSDETKVFRPDGVLPGKHITHWMTLPEAPEEE